MSNVEPFTDIESPRKYGPVGKCIYCGAVGTKLTDEHIIPYSLKGLVELTQSSCVPCAKVTGKIEGYIGRTLWGNVRMRHGFPTRRPRSRPATTPITAIVLGAETELQLPTTDFPACAPFVWLPRASALTGFEGPQVQVRMFVADSEAAKNAGMNLKFEIKMDFPQYFRFLAKIAHGFATLNLGIDGFEPVLPSLILGNSNINALKFVGGSLDVQAPDDSMDVLHTAGVRLAKEPTGEWVVVHLRLFCTMAERSPEGLLGTPNYEIVAGRANELTRERLRPTAFY